MLAVMVAAIAAIPLFVSGTAGAAELTQKIISEPNMVDIAFDSAGNLYESESNGDVNVWPTSSGSIFGQSVTAGEANTLVTLNNVPGIAFDASGDLFISNDDGPSGGSISVLPANDGTIFGQSVTADTLTTVISGLDNPVGLSFDSAGNLYYATQNDISVLPLASGTIFGQSVSADTPTTLVSGLTQGMFLAFDSNEDLFYTDAANFADDAASLNVLPQNSGTIYGQSVTADTPQALLTGLTVAAGLAFDNSGNLYVDYFGNVGVLSNSTGTIDGTNVSADTFTQVATGLLGDLGSTAFNGGIYIADQLLDSVDELATPTATIRSVTFGGTAANPVVFVDGSGFDTSPPTYPIATRDTSCSSDLSGIDFEYGNLYLHDSTGNWDAGVPGDCVGLTLANLTSTQAVYTFGSDYNNGDGYSLDSGDSFTVGVSGTTYSGTVSYTAASEATITKVKPHKGPGAGHNVVTITGTHMTGTEYVFFGSVPVSNFNVNASGTEVSTDAPPGSGTVNVTLASADDEVSATSPSDDYTYLAPVITTLSPPKSPIAGGITVTITGTDLQDTTSVMFGSEAATSFHQVSATEVTAVAPPESGPIKVELTLTTPGGTSNSLKFKYKA
jgi:IPT/TIG domain